MRWCNLIIVPITLILILSCSHAISIPSFLKICHRNDPHINECVKRSIDSLRPYLRSGIAELNIPPCEPLKIPEIDLSQAAGPVAMKSKYSNIVIEGGTKFVIRSIKLDIDNDNTRLKLFIPKLTLTSDYSINGKILVLPIAGHGQIHGNFTDVNINLNIQGEQYVNKRTKKQHFRIRECDVDLDIDHARVHLDNLFDGDKVLADGMNNFINENWKIVSADMRPAIQRSIAKLLKEFSNNIYAKYPVDILLPL